MSDFFSIPEDQINESQQAMQAGGVRLPFPVVYARWLNGSTTAKRTEGKKDVSDARYFGGWEIGLDQMDEYAAMTASEPPLGWELVTQSSKQGGEYDAYITRWIAFSPIATRKWWEKSDFGGVRSKVQILGYLAQMKDKVYQPWGAVVLTASGLSGAAIEDAITEFGIKTAAARREHSNSLPPMFFWNILGTFGERNQRMVGKGNNKSPITPCQVYLGKDEISEDTLKKLFVGQEIAKLRSDLLHQAQDWLEAKKGGDTDQETTPEDFVPPPTEQDVMDNLDAAFGDGAPF